MGVIQKQFIQDSEGEKIGIILSLTEYESLMEYIEELEDIIAYDKAKAEPSDAIPFDTFLKELH